MGLIGKEKVNISRPTGGAYDSKGRWVEGTEPIIHKNEMVTITPLSGNELLLLTEGDRNKQPMNLFTITMDIELKDIITRTRDGLRYKILKTESYETTSLKHIKATMLLIEGQ